MTSGWYAPRRGPPDSPSRARPGPGPTGSGPRTCWFPSPTRAAWLRPSASRWGNEASKPERPPRRGTLVGVQPVLTAAQTEAIDRETGARGTSVSDLMERAGAAVARAALDLTAGGYGRRAVVVVGKGNNGGDGLVAARYLARAGMRVGVHFLIEEPASGLREPALSNFHRLGEADVRWWPFSAERLSRDLHWADVAVDAIFGTGFRGRPEGDHATAIDGLNAGGGPVVAVDIPSGVEGDTGAVRGPAVRASVTVALGALKAGDVLFPGAAHAGLVEVADIGFPEDLMKSDVFLVEPEDAADLLPERGPDDHKRRSGVVLVVAGSRRMTGAPRLVARGAYRAGAGLVQVAVPEAILPVVQAGVGGGALLGLSGGASRR